MPKGSRMMKNRIADVMTAEAMNPLLPVIIVLLLVIIGLIYYAAYLLDTRERLLRRLEGAAHGYPKKHV